MRLIGVPELSVDRFNHFIKIYMQIFFKKFFMKKIKATIAASW